MKTLNFLAICAAAMAFAACNVEEPVAPRQSQDLVTVHFGAEVVEPVATKATLTPGETDFVAHWSVGDEVSICYTVLGFTGFEIIAEGVATGVWNGSSFDAQIPDYEGQWTYRATYPAIGEYDFVNVSQDGAGYNSICDVMESDAVESIGPAGKDEDGNDIVFPMHRQNAIAYFHLTSNLDEPVVSAKLSVKEGMLAFQSVSIFEETGEDNHHYISQDWQEPANYINLAVSGQNAKDFTLWFNVSYDWMLEKYEDVTLTVTTGTKTMTLTRTGSAVYEPGLLYKVDTVIPDEKWETR